MFADMGTHVRAEASPSVMDALLRWSRTVQSRFATPSSLGSGREGGGSIVHGSTLQSLPSYRILKKAFHPRCSEALLIHVVLSGQSWHVCDEQLCGLASLTLFCSPG